MINTPFYKKFRVSEFIQFFTDVIKICIQNNPVQLKINKQLEGLKEPCDKIDSVFKKNQKSDLTEKLEVLDTRRDKALVCISKIADGYLNHFREDKRDAARLITDCIDKYGSRIYDMNYQAETSILSNLGNDLQNKTELANATTVIKVDEVVTEMITANTEFSDCFIDRIEEQAKETGENAGKLINEALQKYRLLVRHIEAHATISPSKERDVLISQLNSLINRYNSTMAMRNHTKPEEVIVEDI